MNHTQELWQEYQANGEPLLNGGRPNRLACPDYATDHLYGVVIVWLYRHSQHGLEFLFQQRSRYVDRYPHEWDVSAGGHINYQESLVTAAIREANEEIGASLAPEHLEYAFSCNNVTRICHSFFYDWTEQPEDFHFNDHEVEQVKWVKYDDIDQFRKASVKSALANDDLYFALFQDWVKNHGHLK